MLFVSHATQDDDFVNRIDDRLKAAGIETWIDHRRLVVGGNWHNAIQDNLVASDGGLIILSPRYVDRPECINELRTLLDLAKPIYPLLIETISKEQFPYRLRTIQYANLARDFDGEMTRLVDAIRAGVAIPADDAPPGKRLTRNYDDRFDTYSVPMQGREADLAKGLADLKQAPLFITGVGGLGKSRLAAEIVRVGDYDGAVWQRASDTSTPEEVYRLLRDHYGLDATTPPEAVIEQVRRSGRLLVVLDNAEALRDAVRPDYERLADALTGAGVALIVTSRVLEWANPRRRWRTIEPSVLEVDQAARVVAAISVELGIERDTAPFAEELAKAARLHPRLIELAVGKLSYQPLDDVLRELRDLTSPDTDEALTEMIRKTADQMESHDPGAKATLKRLAVCRGGFTLAAAQFIWKSQVRSLLQIRLTALIRHRPFREINDEMLRARLKTLIDTRFVRYDPLRERYSI